MDYSKLAGKRQGEDVFLIGSLSSADARKVQRRSEAGELLRIAKGVYVRSGEESEVE
jgi:hypothetical protein